MFITVIGFNTNRRILVKKENIIYVKYEQDHSIIQLHKNVNVITKYNVNYIYSLLLDKNNFLFLHDENNFPLIVNKNYVLICQDTNDHSMISFINISEDVFINESFDKIVEKFNNNKKNNC